MAVSLILNKFNICLPKYPHKLPPNAKVTRISSNCQPFTFHFCLSLSNMRANVRQKVGSAMGFRVKCLEFGVWGLGFVDIRRVWNKQ